MFGAPAGVVIVAPVGVARGDGEGEIVGVGDGVGEGVCAKAPPDTANNVMAAAPPASIAFRIIKKFTPL